MTGPAKILIVGFREDLYYRLDVAKLEVPALVDRREDIPLLYQAFLQEIAARHEREVPKVGPEDLHELLGHAWPGNVRELRNVAERHVLGLKRGTGRLAELIAATGPEPPSLSSQVEAFEKYLIEQALAKHGGRMNETAAALGMPVRTLNDRMRKNGLKGSDFK